MSYYLEMIFKHPRKLALSLVAVFAFASCGSSSGGASKEDAAACEEFTLVATSTINDMTSWIQEREDIEGTAEGFQASLAIAESMLTASSTAAEFSTEGSSKSAQKLFSAAETAFDEAGNAVALRGGSLGASEEALIRKAIESASEIGDFCGTITSSSEASTEEDSAGSESATYPEDVRDNFRTSCVANAALSGGGEEADYEDVCGCLLNEIEARFTVEEFAASEKAMAAGEASGIDMEELGKLCVG